MNDSEEVLAFCRNSKQGSLVAIRQEAQEAGIPIIDEQIQRLILVLRKQEEPEFSAEFLAYYNRHL